MITGDCREYPIGTKYQVRRKNSINTYTVTDILKTYNSKNELTKIRYVATHVFLGQTVTDHDVVPVTIARGIIYEDKES